MPIMYLKPGQQVLINENVDILFRVGATSTIIDSNICWDNVHPYNGTKHEVNPIGIADIDDEPLPDGTIYGKAYDIYLEEASGRFYYIKD